MKPCAVSAALGLALMCGAGESFAQAGVQLRWQAPGNCPQEAQVRQKLRTLLGPSANGAVASRLRAEGRIELLDRKFRLTLNIHYDLVNGTRVVQASSCEDLGGVAAVTLALLFRVEHSSSRPLTARDLGGAVANAGAESGAGASDSQRAGSAESAPDASDGARASERKPAAAEADRIEETEQQRESEVDEARLPKKHASTQPKRLGLLLRAPELRTDIGVLPNASYGMGLGVGMRYDAWRFSISASWWLAQDYESDAFVGYGAHYERVSGELATCHGFRLTTAFELSPCALLWLDDVAARATGVGVSSTNPRTAWLSLGAGLQGIWSLGRHAGLVFAVNGRVATSRPRFVMEGVGAISQVGPVALGLALGLQWLP